MKLMKATKIAKAQISIEYILLIGLILAAVLPIFYYSFTTINNHTKMNKASMVTIKVVETADMLYALGPGSQEAIVIEIPSGVENITIRNNEINLKLRIFTKVSDIFAVSKVNMTGTILVKPGLWHILMKNENNTIQISNQY